MPSMLSVALRIPDVVVDLGDVPRPHSADGAKAGARLDQVEQCGELCSSSMAQESVRLSLSGATMQRTGWHVRPTREPSRPSSKSLTSRSSTSLQNNQRGPHSQ